MTYIAVFLLPHSGFMRKISAICNHLCKSLFPDTFEIDESVKKYTITENFIFICNHAMVWINIEHKEMRVQNITN